jgi:homocysteine S-methyltransferase
VPVSLPVAPVGRSRQTESMTASATIVLDGGMSNALQDRGHDLTGDLWTARLLRDAPAEIAAVHRTYFAAGARVATTASYQASDEGFTRLGLTRTAAEGLIRRSVLLAREVRDDLSEDGVERWVAASVGPYGAALADGSEYRGRYGVSAAWLRDFHRPRLELLASAGPDLIAVETIPDVEEAEVLVELLDQIGLPAWFSYSAVGQTPAGTNVDVRSSHVAPFATGAERQKWTYTFVPDDEGGPGPVRLQTRAGQPLEDAFRIAATSRSVIAVGVNCCAPDAVLPAVRLAVQTTGLPAVAYPNRGEVWDSAQRTWSGLAHFDPALAAAWVDAGARYVGGCCRVGPRDIAAIADALR